jgi:hypothetical protein
MGELDALGKDQTHPLKGLKYLDFQTSKIFNAQKKQYKYNAKPGIM